MSANSPSSEDGLCLTDNALIEIFISYDRSVAERFIEGLSGSPSTSNTTGDPTSTQIVEALTLVYESLPASDKKRFDSLHDPGDNGVVSRFKHNSLLLKKADNGYVLCVFEIMVNTRHSCQPNAIVEWSQRCQAWRLLSLKDIEKGEKILICYLAGSFLKTVEERNKELQDRYSFTCTCPACDPNHPNNPNSVERRKQLKTYYDNLDMSKCMIGSGSQCKLENIDEASQSAVIQAYSYRALLEQEGIHDHRVAEA